MWRSFLRWMNREKAAFSVATLWLLAMGLHYQRGPSLVEWGPQRTDVPPPEALYVNLDAPPPISEFLAGDRGTPFSDIKRRTAFRPKPLPRYRPPKPPASRRKRKPPRKAPPPPPPPPPPKAAEGPAGKPKPYDLPVRVVGRVEVGGSGARTVFVVKEDGRYIAVREGEELPGLGVRVVRATKSVVIVENEKGQRFRLIDLLRSKAAEDEGEAEGE